MKQRGNLLLTFILLIAIIAVILSFIYIIIGRTKDVQYEINRSKSFYIAQAGLNKAIWCLITPTGLGGRGNSWRTAGSTEGYAGGQYTMIVTDGPSQSIVITATGEINSVSRTLQESISSSSLPIAFNYGVFSNGNLSLSGNSEINGDIFANGNITIQKPENHQNGIPYVSAGHTVNGSPGTVPEVVPSMPSFNSTYYDGQITIAQTAPGGSQNINNVDLGGSTIYVRGSATISGTITGGGAIVVAGATAIDDATISSNTTLISNGPIAITGTTNVQSGGLIYSPSNISISESPRLSGSIISAGISISGSPTIYGILFSWSLSTTLSGTVNVYGSVVNPSSTSYGGHVEIEYDPAYLPFPPPPGLAAGGYSVIKGSWKEL